MSQEGIVTYYCTLQIVEPKTREWSDLYCLLPSFYFPLMFRFFQIQLPNFFYSPVPVRHSLVSYKIQEDGQFQTNSSPKRLLRMCMGAALAIAFHEAGLHVYATAQDVSKMTKFVHLVSKRWPSMCNQSESPIAASVSRLSSQKLGVMVINTGASASMPSDLSLPEAKELFDINMWSQFAVIQTFLPLLLKSKGMTVNQMSVVSTTAISFQSSYHASKAAMAMFSDAMRLE